MPEETEYDDYYVDPILLDSIEQIYKQSEVLKLLAWEAVYFGQTALEHSGEIKPGERRIDAQAEFRNNVLKVVINDVLPRKQNRSPSTTTRLYWMGNVVDAIKKLDVAVYYERALCSIKVYGQRDVGWDVDNRAINYIVNGLRMANVIPGDEWYNLSLILLGELDKENPRTEIRVTEYSENDLKALFKGM